MRDSDFIRDEKVPMSKEEVRYISLCYMDINNKKNMLDIGSGTGSCSIEALLQNKNLTVTAIECDDKAIDVINKNIEKFDNEYFNIKNRINVIKARAPVELDEKFDSIFVGGTKGSVDEIINWSVKNMNIGATLVLNFITLENFYEALESINKIPNLSEITGSQIMVNKIEKLAKYKYLKPNNPVFIIKCIKNY